MRSNWHPEQEASGHDRLRTVTMSGLPKGESDQGVKVWLFVALKRYILQAR